MKMRNKRLLCILALLAFLTVGCAKTPASPSNGSTDPTSTTGSDAEVPTDSTTESTAESTESSTESTTSQPTDDPVAAYVQPDIVKTVQWKDTLDNQYSISISLPKLLPFSEDAKACQTQIDEYFKPILEDIQIASTEGFGTFTFCIDYQVFLNQNILSLITIHDTGADFIDYMVFNFNTSTGKLLDTAALMQELNIADYEEKAVQAAQAAFLKMYSSAMEDPDDFTCSQLNATICEENIAASMPYLDAEGQLMAIINIYSLAGASYYPEVISLS